MIFHLFETCTTYLVQNVIPDSIKVPLFKSNMMDIQIFEKCTTYLVRNGIPNSIKFPRLELKITEVHFFETCTRYLDQNGIQKSTKWSLDPHFWSVAVQDEPGRPAGPAWPPAPAWPAGGPRWRPMGQLAAIPRCSSWQWVRGEAGREEAGQTTAPPPHSYHRRWVIWYMRKHKEMKEMQQSGARGTAHRIPIQDLLYYVTC